MLRIAMVVLLLVSPASLSKGLVDVEYQNRLNRQQQAMYELIVDSGVTEEFVEIVTALLPFKHPIRLIYGNSTTEGPYYEPEIHTLYIPYAFVSESLYYFSQDRSKGEAKQASVDTLMHTLLHEAGHALVEDNQIPILGKEEDAVDNLATILMINYLEDGEKAAINAADMFGYESENGGEFYNYSEYAGVHSFDLQRYFATLCLVYGSNPEVHAQLLNEIEEEDALLYQQESCEENYQLLLDSWHQYLEQPEMSG